MVLSNLSLGKTFITCIVGRSFATECLYMKHEKLLLMTWFIQHQQLYVRLTLVSCLVI